MGACIISKDDCRRANHRRSRDQARLIHAGVMRQRASTHFQNHFSSRWISLPVVSARAKLDVDLFQHTSLAQDGIEIELILNGVIASRRCTSSGGFSCLFEFICCQRRNGA